MAAQFSWAAAADVGLGVAGALGSWATASANRRITKANADAANLVRTAQNKQKAANVTLAATARGLATKAALTNAGEAVNSGSELFARTQEAWTRGDFERGLRNMEELGAYAARAAASGMGGASVDAVSRTIQLQHARLEERSDERNAETLYELNKQRTGIMPAAVSRLDVSPLTGNFDYSQNIAPSGSGSGLIPSLIEGLLSKPKSLQVALDSIERRDERAPGLTTGDFSRADRELYQRTYADTTINID